MNKVEELIEKLLEGKYIFSQGIYQRKDFNINLFRLVFPIDYDSSDLLEYGGYNINTRGGDFISRK